MRWLAVLALTPALLSCALPGDANRGLSGPNRAVWECIEECETPPSSAWSRCSYVDRIDPKRDKECEKEEERCKDRCDPLGTVRFGEFIDALGELVEILMSPRDEKSDDPVALDSVQPERLRVLADAGDVEAGYELAQLLRSEDSPEALRWFCMAANRGHANAQFELGLYFDSQLPYFKTLPSQRPDDAIAYIWFSRADKNGSKWAPYKLRALAERMSDEELARAERMSREWTLGNCPSPTSQLDPVTPKLSAILCY